MNLSPMEQVKARIESMRNTNPDSNQLCKLLDMVEGLIQEDQRPIMKNNAITEKLNNLIDEMTEAEYLCMTDMKWVADRIREFAEEEARSLALERPTERPEGKCPTCHGLIRTTERRPDGDSTCAFGHKHKTADFYKPTPTPQLVEAEEVMEFVRNIRDNYDHDEDAHKYNTLCRCCEAEKLLAKFKGATK